MMELPEYSMSYNEINYIYSFAMLFISWWADLNWKNMDWGMINYHLCSYNILIKLFDNVEF